MCQRYRGTRRPPGFFGQPATAGGQRFGFVGGDFCHPANGLLYTPNDLPDGQAVRFETGGWNTGAGLKLPDYLFDNVAGFVQLLLGNHQRRGEADNIAVSGLGQQAALH